MNELDLPAILSLYHAYLQTVSRMRDRLTELDGRFGDGDLGVNLELGLQAVCAHLEQIHPASLLHAMREAGLTMNRAASSTLGTLIAFSWIAAAKPLEGKHTISLDDWIEITQAGLASVRRMGKAAPGDKTIIDAWLPYLEALRAAHAQGQTLADASHNAATAAEQAAEDTASMPARVGRAAMYGDQARGFPDGGAVAFSGLMRCFADFAAGSS